MNILNEEWRDVVGYEGYYQVSDLGRVRSLDRRSRCRGGSTSFHKGVILSPALSKSGYFVCVLCVKGRMKTFLVHCLVASAFLGDKPHGFDVNHIDTDKQNNLVGNLEYITKSANTSHAYKHGLCLNGELHPKAKLKDIDIPEIRRMISSGEDVSSVARRFGVVSATISRIAKGKTWHHIP